MDTIGIDLHKRESQRCIITTEGELIACRIGTSRDRRAATLGDRDQAQILVEASTESEWVARHLESLGHTVTMASPDFAPMYASRSKRVPTDKRDARAWCAALRLGAYREIRRASEARRHLRAQLAVRDALVRTRTRDIAVIKASVRRVGLRMSSGEAIPPSWRRPLPPHAHEEQAPLVAVWGLLREQLAAVDAARIAIAASDPVVTRVRTMPSIGPITSPAFVAALDDVTRFPNAHQVRGTSAWCRVSTAPAIGGCGAASRNGARAAPLAVGGNGVARSPRTQRRPAGAPDVGAADGGTVGQTHRRGRAGPSRGRHPVRDVARRRPVPRRAAGGGCLTRFTPPQTPFDEEEMTDRERESTMQRMAAGETEAQ